jgi:hypothetical protein
MSSRVTLYNKETRELLSFSVLRARLNRVKLRIRAWASLVLSLSGFSLIHCTLTYRDVDGWQPYDIHHFLDAWTKRYTFIVAYSWVVELQKRGAPHYHVIFVVPRGFLFDSYPDASGLWPHGRSKTKFVFSPYYLIKYLNKQYQKDYSKLPKGMRVFAVVVRRAHLSRFSFRAYWFFRLSALGAYFRDLFSRLASCLSDDDLRGAGWWRRPRGGGVLWDGYLLRSPWVFIRVEYS